MTNLPYFLFIWIYCSEFINMLFAIIFTRKCVIVVYPDHTYLFYLLKKRVSRPGNVTTANREEEANTKTHLNNEYN